MLKQYKKNDSDKIWMIIDKRVNSFWKWIIDSNVSKHMISNKSIFIQKRTINCTMTMINDDVLKIYEIDEIRIDLKNQSIAITNVLYVFNFDANLLFISILNKKNFSIMFYKKKIEMQKKNILIVTKIVKKKYFLRTIETTFWIVEKKISEKFVFNR